MKLIQHICVENDLIKAQSSGSYRCDSLDSEGFIHCCLPEQMAGVVERYYSGANGLKVMHINSDELQVAAVFENTVGGEELFPHIYGEINMRAVIEVTDL